VTEVAHYVDLTDLPVIHVWHLAEVRAESGDHPSPWWQWRYATWASPSGRNRAMGSRFEHGLRSRNWQRVMMGIAGRMDVTRQPGAPMVTPLSDEVAEFDRAGLVFIIPTGAECYS
jgi:hypothetical protein